MECIVLLADTLYVFHNQRIELDGSSTFDPDLAPYSHEGVEFEWRCKNESLVLLIFVTHNKYDYIHGFYFQFNSIDADNPASLVATICPFDSFASLTDHSNPTLSFDISGELLNFNQSVASDIYYTFQLCVSKPLHPPSECVERLVGVKTTKEPSVQARLVVLLFTFAQFLFIKKGLFTGVQVRVKLLGT